MKQDNQKQEVFGSSVPQEEWVPWKVGADILNISRGSFFHLVETEQIRAEPNRGPRSGRYNMQDILNVKKRREAGKPRKQYKKRESAVLIDWLRITDVPAVLKLNHIVYHDYLLTAFDLYTKWLEKNPYIFIAAFDKNRDNCLGYLGLTPFPERVILDIVSGKREESSIELQEVEPDDRLGEFTLLANRIAIHPNYSELLFRLIDEVMEIWVKKFPEQYVRKVYALVTNTECDMAVQMFHMAPRYDLKPENVFELDLARPGVSSLIRDFQQKLKEKAPLPPNLWLFADASKEEL